MTRKCKKAQLIIEHGGVYRRVASLRFGKGEFFLVPEQKSASLRCGTWDFEKGETRVDVEFDTGGEAQGRGLHLSFHRDGRVHAREGNTEYARTDGCPLTELSGHAHVATIEISSIDRLPVLERKIRRNLSAKQDWIFPCPATMTRGRFPIFVAQRRADLPADELNVFPVRGGDLPLFVGLRLMGQTTYRGPDAKDLVVIGGWDPRIESTEEPDRFVWVSVELQPPS